MVARLNMELRQQMMLAFYGVGGKYVPNAALI